MPSPRTSFVSDVSGGGAADAERAGVRSAAHRMNDPMTVTAMRGIVFLSRKSLGTTIGRSRILDGPVSGKAISAKRDEGRMKCRNVPVELRTPTIRIFASADSIDVL